ncbi:MAG: response regulator [Victivallales bacterium]|nr:response regulator [Victivallales bacterium]
MKLRTAHKILLLALAILLVSTVMLVHDAFTLRKCVVLSGLQNVFNQVASDMELQHVYLMELGNVRAAHGDETELKTQIEESSARIDAEFNRISEKEYVAVLPGVFSLSDLWSSLKEHRVRVASGYDVLKNSGLANAAYIAFRQELKARQEELSKLHSGYIVTTFKNTVKYSAVMFVLLIVLCWVYWKGTVKPLKRIEALLALLNPKATASRDISDVKDIEGDIKRLNLQNQENTDAKDSFFAGMSHEIRTPLNGIIGFLGSLAETNLNPQQMQYLNVIDSSAKSLLHIIDEILDFSKINSKKLELENVAFDLKALLEDRVAFASQLLRNKKNVKLVALLPEEHSIIIRSDPTRIRQVIDNLLSNAVKFTEQGEITFQVNAMPNDDNCVAFDVSVADTGIGISVQEQERLFKPYSQANKSTTRRYGGTGLGLAISSSIVHLLGGELAVSSRPGEGTTFSFSFSAPRGKQEEQLHLSGNFQIILPTAELRKKYALLVDDTPTNLFLLETICQSIGLPYRTAQNGLEAVKFCQQDKFDLIFMDIQMPVMDGYAAMKSIRALPDSGTVHIIALTASAYQEDVEHALASGANSFIPKPFERDQLLLCIADALAIEPQRKLCQPLVFEETSEETTVREMHEYMRERYRISLGEIKMILAQTASDWRPILDSLGVFARKGQLEEVKPILHKLKGQLSSIGLPELAELSATIMEESNEGAMPLDKIQTLIDTLSAIFKTLEKQVTVG